MRCILGILVAMLPVSSLDAQALSIHSHGGCAVGRNSTGVSCQCAPAETPRRCARSPRSSRIETHVPE